MKYKVQPLEKVLEVNNNNRNNNSFNQSKESEKTDFSDMLEHEKGRLQKIEVIRELKNQLTSIQEIYTLENHKRLK